MLSKPTWLLGYTVGAGGFIMAIVGERGRSYLDGREDVSWYSVDGLIFAVESRQCSGWAVVVCAGRSREMQLAGVQGNGKGH
jgi:hypothetical protein